ncbi:adenylate/guanylate cyclase domain-containing protein [Algoriphagus halophilus]|uniref:Adenylate cyclase, class 3 n=1 Tax=Algoriphagus halophilus TaxID=226505 RepID=A0A1N6DKZ1_9BACT|nr:tetratricopeptide repeat protein [Algoriphagus halophilus]SIN71455.1 Adenylate cyclase, class 3 [Algoriphagus halophilus]
MDQVLNRKHSIVYFSDIVGYTLLMGQDEDHAFELMKQNLVLHSEVFEKHRGKIIKELGDGILAIFETAEEALEASLEIQKEWGKSSELELRIGLHCGGIILDNGDVYGDAVNVASRIQSIGVPSCVLFSSDVLANLPNHSRFTHINLGLFRLKNVAKELELHALTNPPLATPKRADMIKKVKSQEREPWKFWVALASTLTILLFLIYSLLWNNYTWEKEKSVAVLPFTNVDPKASQDVYSKDITQEIISQLSEVNDIKVISYGSIKDIRNPNLNLDSLAEILEVSTVLKGSIQYLGDMTKVNVQFIDVEENKNLWTSSFTRSGQDLLRIQSEIAKEISRVLGISLSAKEEAEIGKVLTSSPDAYEWYLKAKEKYSEYNPESYNIAVEYFKKAIEIDPNFTLAYAGLADTYAQLSLFDSSNSVSEKGLLIDSNSAELYKTRGNTYYYLGELDNAKKSFEIAISIKPNYSEAIGNLATVYMIQGHLAKALLLQQKSSTLNPTSYIPFQISGWIYRILNRFDLALDWLEKANSIKFDPVTSEQIAYLYLEQGNKEKASEAIEEILADSIHDLDYVYSTAGFIEFWSGEHQKSREFFEKAILENPEILNDPFNSAAIPLAYANLQSGKTEIADSLIKNAISIREKGDNNPLSTDPVILFDLAQLEVLNNRKARAINYLDQAVAYGFRDDFHIISNPIFDAYRSDSKFQSILKEISQKHNELNKELRLSEIQLQTKN